MVLTLAQSALSVLVLSRLARGRARRQPLKPLDGTPHRISVVIPARDEASRIGPCLEALGADGDAFEVIVVDDRSADATASVARGHGARVIAGAELPPGWVGKPWALQQGLEAARGDVVVCLDADTIPKPGLLGALAAELEGGLDFVSVGPRFVCDTAGERFLHPALLATLVYRCGPGDVEEPARLIANGQCTAVRREPFLEAGGYALRPGNMTDDVALVQALASLGRRVAFRDGAEVLEVDMHASAAEVWREWGRSIALTDVTPRRTLALDVATVWLVLALPMLRLVARRPSRLDLALLALRAAMLGATARSYSRRGPAFWLSPLADPVAAVRLTLSAARPPRTWKNRSYGE